MNTEGISRIYFARIVRSLGKTGYKCLADAVEILRNARKKNNNVWIVGNGGSASTASHLANDLTKMAGVKAFSVPDMTATTLAYGNDNGWKYMFVDTISKLYREGDVLFAISCSGNSPNVIACTEFIQHPIIALTGDKVMSKLAQVKDAVVIHANDDDITVQESIHSTICHLLAVILRDEL